MMSKYKALFETKIAGIPCIAAVTYYEPGLPAYLSGNPDDAQPEDAPDIDYVILDRRGYKAAWLEKKATAQDYQRIFNEIAEGLC
jgi:hypothetical protein